MKRKSNTLKKQKTSMTNKKEKVKDKKEEVLPSTANTLSYQALYQNGLMQVKEDYFSQSYLLGDVNYQTVGLEDKGAIIEKYSDLTGNPYPPPRQRPSRPAARFGQHRRHTLHPPTRHPIRPERYSRPHQRICPPRRRHTPYPRPSAIRRFDLVSPRRPRYGQTANRTGNPHQRG